MPSHMFQTVEHNLYRLYLLSVLELEHQRAAYAHLPSSNLFRNRYRPSRDMIAAATPATIQIGAATEPERRMQRVAQSIRGSQSEVDLYSGGAAVQGT